MANENTNITLNTGTEKLRATLSARNLYTPYQEYPLQKPSNVDKVVAGINTVIKGITPFSSYDLTNTVYGRLVTSSTPLAEVGLVMLGKQFALNSMSSLAQTKFPTIKPSNLWDGSKDTKLFTLKENYSITIKESKSGFQKFVDDVIYYYPQKDYPFTKHSKNSDLIKNTGTAQLNVLYSNINKNPYKESTRLDSTFQEYAEVADTQIFPRSSVINTGITTFYNFNDAKFDPYLRLGNSINGTSIINANNNMISSVIYADSVSNEYAPDANFVDTVLGQTNKTASISKEQLSIEDSNTWISDTVEFSGDNLNDKIVWGLTDATPEVIKNLSPLRPGISEDAINSGIQSNDLDTHFNVRAGLLEYTRNLINATEGRIGDITRKAFTDGDKLVGFQGSGLWKSNNSSYAIKSKTAGKRGTRQHTVIDQYDKFAKAIRFNGNEVYGGNPDSVIYNSVLPKIHPMMNEKNDIDNTNMMFSIENLAVKVIGNGDFGIVDDDEGNTIPLCEVGPFDGRIMWFPPYNLEINETATAKYEPTVMIGRNEPMYNYMHSERGATLQFSLIIDYPEQLKNFKGGDRQKAISEFFAFGGDVLGQVVETVEELELKIKLIQDKINDVEGKTEVIEPNIIPPLTLGFYFPNDVPKVSDNLNTIFNKMYDKYDYEIVEDSISSDGSGFGLNDEIYHISSMISYTKSGTTYYSASTDVEQYNVSGVTNQENFGDLILNKSLKDFFSNKENIPLYDIKIVGAASKLYTEANDKDIVEEENYNEALGKRRADAVENLITKRLFAIFGTDTNDVIFHTDTIGSSAAKKENATAKRIPALATKEERVANATIIRNTVVPEPKKVPLSEEDKKNIYEWKLEIEAIYTKIDRLKNLASDCVYEERTTDDPNGAGDTGILHGFQSVSGNYYYPVFHSQTPEDFHKRLTFLQQCTRQGSAKRYELVNEEGNLRAKNSVFGRQPICILRVGDFLYTKIILETVTIDYAETTWDMNPEGFGMQPMIANVTLNMKLIGGQSLKGPIAALQNAASYNHYANSSYTAKGMYKLPSRMADEQATYVEGIKTAEIKAKAAKKAELEKNVKHKE